PARPRRRRRPGRAHRTWSTRARAAASADEAKPDETRRRRVAADQRSEARTEDNDEGLTPTGGSPSLTVAFVRVCARLSARCQCDALRSHLQRRVAVCRE